jgi:hypothetical protein
MGIYECDEGGEGQIEFVRDAGNFEQGIIYFDHPINTDYLLDIKLIRENWYYYMTIHE